MRSICPMLIGASKLFLLLTHCTKSLSQITNLHLTTEAEEERDMFQVMKIFIFRREKIQKITFLMVIYKSTKNLKSLKINETLKCNIFIKKKKKKNSQIFKKKEALKTIKSVLLCRCLKSQMTEACCKSACSIILIYKINMTKLNSKN